MCPHCGRDAPMVYRGIVPYCTACGGVRAPLSGRSTNLAGRPAKVGGAVATVAGWLVLVSGLSLALGIGVILQLIFSLTLALALSLPLAIVSLAVGMVLLGGGRRLARSGSHAEEGMRTSALLAAVAQHGQVNATDAARLLGVTVSEADAALTDLAKREPEQLSVDIDDQGNVWFRNPRLGAAHDPRFGPRARVGGSNAVATPPRTRIGARAEDVESDAEADEALAEARNRR